LKTFFNILDKRPARQIWRLTLLLVVILSFFSATLGKSIFLEIFYFLPITLASWYGSKKSGIILSLTSAVLLFLIDALNTQFIPMKIATYGLPCAISFSTLAILVTNFRSVHREESVAADTDTLTSICNSRSFYHELTNELVRSRRYKHFFSLAYLDIDNFKYVNDSMGHVEGDKLLIEVAKCLKANLRETDTVARLGGDEFACLFPETGEEESKSAFEKTSSELERLMICNHWPVSFSIGLVTFKAIPKNIKDTMKIADDLMYSVKNSGKNSICFELWKGKD